LLAVGASGRLSSPVEQTGGAVALVTAGHGCGAAAVEGNVAHDATGVAATAGEATHGNGVDYAGEMLVQSVAIGGHGGSWRPCGRREVP
jgi:hypothetical protein